MSTQLLSHGHDLNTAADMNWWLYRDGRDKQQP